MREVCKFLHDNDVLPHADDFEVSSASDRPHCGSNPGRCINDDERRRTRTRTPTGPTSHGVANVSQFVAAITVWHEQRRTSQLQLTTTSPTACNDDFGEARGCGAVCWRLFAVGQGAVARRGADLLEAGFLDACGVEQVVQLGDLSVSRSVDGRAGEHESVCSAGQPDEERRGRSFSVPIVCPPLLVV